MGLKEELEDTEYIRECVFFCVNHYKTITQLITNSDRYLQNDLIEKGNEILIKLDHKIEEIKGKKILLDKQIESIVGEKIID